MGSESMQKDELPVVILRQLAQHMQIHIGIITISDRASQGLYADLGGPALKAAAELLAARAVGQSGGGRWAAE